LGGWIRAFNGVVHLHVEPLGRDNQLSLAPLYGISPTLKSLRLVHTSVPSPEVLGLVCSFPLLEDLALVSFGRSNMADQWNIPPTSPKFTGSLNLTMMTEIRSAARQLCSLPGGLHFTKITLSCLIEDLEPTANLISMCSETLEYLSVSCYLPGAFRITFVSGRHLIATPRSRVVKDLLSRSLQGCTVKRPDVRMRKAGHLVDHNGAPNYQIQGSSADHHSPEC
jgi:hypothetical protein